MGPWIDILPDRKAIFHGSKGWPLIHSKERWKQNFLKPHHYISKQKGDEETEKYQLLWAYGLI